MAEILTESFCERCGTRYTFESPAKRSNALGALGTMSRGIRNFVASPDQTIDEAFAVAKAESEQRATAHQLEAFHQTFNFCLSCRQYTCGNCWNHVEGRCQSCAPLPEDESTSIPEVIGATRDADSLVVAEAMAIARAATMPGLEEPVPAVEAETEAPAEPEALADPEPFAEPDAPAEPEALGGAAADETDVTIPEVDLASRLASVSSRLAEPIAEPDVPEADRPAEPEPEIEPEPEPEPLAVAEPRPPASTEPEPVVRADASDDADSAAPTLQFPPGVSLDEEIAAYDLRVAALSTPTPEPEAEPPATLAPEPIGRTDPGLPAAPLDWPMAAEHAAPRASASDTTGPARLAPRYVPGPVPELPDASPVALPAAQSTGSCASCGLSLSATARFCRRCGTAQHVA